MSEDDVAAVRNSDVVKDFYLWGEQTFIALGGGFVFGFAKGYGDSAHLAGKYGPNNIYRGLFAEFRVPLRIMHATGSSVSWGAKIGFFTSTFSAIQLFLHRKRKQAIETSAKTESDSPFKAIICHDASSVLPTAAAGTVVGGMFGFRGGLIGIIRGSSAGLALSVAVGGFHYLLEKAAKDLEAKLDADRSSTATNGTKIAQKP